MDDSRQQDILTFLRPDEQPAVSPPRSRPIRGLQRHRPSLRLQNRFDNLRWPSMSMRITSRPNASVGPLLSLFGQMLASKVAEAVVAGNNHGKEIDRWRGALIAHAPDIAVRPLDVPARRQAADAALVMALGQDLDRHIRERGLVVVVSRDEFLIRAAEQAKSSGCNILLACAGTAGALPPPLQSSGERFGRPEIAPP